MFRAVTSPRSPGGSLRLKHRTSTWLLRGHTFCSQNSICNYLISSHPAFSIWATRQLQQAKCQTPRRIRRDGSRQTLLLISFSCIRQRFGIFACLLTASFTVRINMSKKWTLIHMNQRIFTFLPFSDTQDARSLGRSKERTRPRTSLFDWSFSAPVAEFLSRF